MTAERFRRLALRLPEVVESSHQAHPDFRFQGRIFATLGYPDRAYGMVRLTPEQQAEAIRASPSTFRPAAGAWGRNGSTVILLAEIDERTLRPILRCGYANVAAPKKARRVR